MSVHLSQTKYTRDPLAKTEIFNSKTKSLTNGTAQSVQDPSLCHDRFSWATAYNT